MWSVCVNVYHWWMTRMLFFLCESSLWSVNLLVEAKYRKYTESLIKCSICTNHNPINNLRVAEKLKVYIPSGRNTFYLFVILALFSFSHAADSKFNSVLFLLTCLYTWFKQPDNIEHRSNRKMVSFIDIEGQCHNFSFFIPKEIDCLKKRQLVFKNIKTNCI